MLNRFAPPFQCTPHKGTCTSIGNRYSHSTLYYYKLITAIREIRAWVRILHDCSSYFFFGGFRRITINVQILVRFHDTEDNSFDFVSIPTQRSVAGPHRHLASDRISIRSLFSETIISTKCFFLNSLMTTLNYFWWFSNNSWFEVFESCFFFNDPPFCCEFFSDTPPPSTECYFFFRHPPPFEFTNFFSYTPLHVVKFFAHPPQDLSFFSYTPHFRPAPAPPVINVKSLMPKF